MLRAGCDAIVLTPLGQCSSMEEILVCGSRTMLPRSDNERICRVGPGTPMGEVFRRYWLPVCVSTQIAKPDVEPLRVSLLGGRLVVFSDSNRKVAFVADPFPLPAA